MKAFQDGQPGPYMQGLQFDVPAPGTTADPDEMTLGETMMHKMGEKLGLTDG